MLLAVIFKCYMDLIIYKDYTDEFIGYLKPLSIKYYVIVFSSYSLIDRQQ